MKEEIPGDGREGTKREGGRGEERQGKGGRERNTKIREEGRYLQIEKRGTSQEGWKGDMREKGRDAGFQV